MAAREKVTEPAAPKAKAQAAKPAPRVRPEQERDQARIKAEQATRDHREQQAKNAAATDAKYSQPQPPQAADGLSTSETLAKANSEFISGR